MDSLKDYLKKRVDIHPISGCWNWNASLNSYRYGSAYFKGTREMAHRASYREFVGEIPIGMNVCHKCDNTKCINPDHLFIGSQKDNVMDAVKKGHYKGRPQSFNKGENHIMAKLNNADIFQIKNGIRTGMRTKDLSALFGVKPCTISDIKYGRRWKHIGALNGKV